MVQSDESSLLLEVQRGGRIDFCNTKITDFGYAKQMHKQQGNPFGPQADIC